MLHKRLFFTLILFLTSIVIYAIPYQFQEKIKWSSVQSIKIEEGFSFQRLSFEGAFYNGFEAIPHFRNTYAIHTDEARVSAILQNEIVAVVTESEKKLLLQQGFNDTSFSINANLALSRKEPFTFVDVVPVRWNVEKQIFEKLVSFDIIIEVEDIPGTSYKKSGVVTNSVLSSGDWYKVRIDKSGLFRITYQELQEMGFDLSGDPRNIAVFGNGGGILPEKNDEFRYDDLVENAIQVVGEDDGNFNTNDYVLFYGEGPVTWAYNYITGRFFHQTNYYDDYSYYYITKLNRPGKRIQTINPPQGPADFEVTKFQDYASHEIDQRNLAGSGRIWYGELFDFNSTYEFNFSFPNIIKTENSGHYVVELASISNTLNKFLIHINNELEKTLTMPTISPTNSYQIAKERGTSFTFIPSASQLTVKLVYQRSSSSSSGYLDYFELNVDRQLIMDGNQMMFREVVDGSTYDLAEYTLRNTGNSINIWDITSPLHARKVDAQLSSGNLKFKASTDSLRQYIAFNGNGYYATEFVEKVTNQNLHSLRNIDYIIVSHPDFLQQANILADFHRQQSDLTVFVTTPLAVYNEFSSGSQDITAIRDFAKMLYDNSDPGNEIKYLLLFGDASYDYKDILPDNTNYVPCWESFESWNIVHSIATDDYVGYLDDGEGQPNSTSDKVDIGIGRFVVANLEEATMAVNKSIHYATNTDDVMGAWRNMITFIADDADGNLHLNHGEVLSNYVYAQFPVYNIDKIYVDAYKQVSTPSGKRIPDANRAINNRMAKGTLIMNYNGHGGETGWGHEQFLTIGDINSWTNYDMMPIFITATCEFSRFDDPTRVSAGELVFLNSEGGAVAMFSTARATFASSNLRLNQAIYENNLFTKQNGKYPHFGDVIRNSKVLGGANDKKFILLGDPGLKLAYPEHQVETTKINGKLIVSNEPDTLNALSQISIEGIITDDDGNRLEDYNGVIYPTIYDKYSEIVTLGDESAPTTFLLRQSVLFNGKASVVNGNFHVEFIVPKDIAYQFGEGRISYYLKNETEDGHGYYEDIIIGGYDKEASEDNEGPEIVLFMNDTTFLSGGTTDENPVMLARVADENGINTTGNGIGHDIMATLDSDDAQSHVLNQYYEADIDSYNSGKITYPFRNLGDGEHVLSLKVWDIYNNSSIAYLNFIVVSGQNLVVENLLNYPNPFVSNTNFVFDHNQAGKELDVKIQVFSTNGELVKTIETRVTSENYKSEPIPWDGSTDSGGKIGGGFYVYRMVVKNPEGSTGEEHSKLVYLRK